MTKRYLIAVTLAAAVPAAFAQSTATSRPLGAAPGTSLGSAPSAPQVPSTGSITRPGDTTLPGTPTTPGLSTLPGAPTAPGTGLSSPLPPSTPGPSVLPSYTDPLDRNSSMGASRPPFGLGGTSRPGARDCVPGSLTNPC